MKKIAQIFVAFLEKLNFTIYWVFHINDRGAALGKTGKTAVVKTFVGYKKKNFSCKNGLQGLY
jgi:hypothetical protein